MSTLSNIHDRMRNDPDFRAQMAEKRNRTPLERALARPTSLAAAVKAKCWDCVGCGHDPNWRGAVAACEITTCGLWHVRPYR